MNQAAPIHTHAPRVPPRKQLCPVLLAVAVAIAAAVILFPWSASAYQVERAGRLLDSDPTSASAGEALLRALDHNPRNAQAHRLLGELDARRGDWLSAAGHWASFVALRPSDPQGHWSLASACERLAVGEWAQSCGSDKEGRQQALTRLWKSAGQTADGFVRAASSLLPGSSEQAFDYYNRALLLDPESVEAWSGLAAFHRAASEEGPALDAYARVSQLAADPVTKAAALAARGEVLAQAGHWLEASSELAAAVGLAPENGGYHLNYGWYLHQAGGSQSIARSHLREAALLLPTNPWPHIHLAVLAFSAEEYAAALEEAHTAAALDQDLFWAWLWRGKALAATGRLSEAEDSLRRAVHLAPGRVEPHVELGSFLQQARRPSEAIPELEMAVQISPRNTSYLLMMATAYRASDREADAVRTFRAVLELDPGNATAAKALEEIEH
ncbi:MAG TPA: tetratricopeptide repeat protein [Anaerolineae bacterium]|nr:tetratricopeptide repeat protein [Anaerolineae bacterium]